MSEQKEYVSVTIEEKIALITINRPPVNALNVQLQNEIKEVFETLATRDDFGVVILRGGSEKAFIVGADIKMISELGTKEAYELSEGTKDILKIIEDFDRVVIAAVNGLALGGGCEVALACDIRVADEGAIFGFPEVGLGLLPGAGGTQRLPRLVGTGKAKELILTGDTVDVSEAKAIGLVERVAPKGKAVPEAKKMAHRILLRGPVAVAYAKKAINGGINNTVEEGFKRESQLFSALFTTQDKKEGIKAFIEKRNPEFTGK